MSHIAGFSDPLMDARLGYGGPVPGGDFTPPPPVLPADAGADVTCTKTACYQVDKAAFKRLQAQVNRFATLPTQTFTPLKVDGLIGAGTVDRLRLAMRKSPLGAGFANNPGWGPALTKEKVAANAGNITSRLDEAATILGAPQVGDIPPEKPASGGGGRPKPEKPPEPTAPPAPPPAMATKGKSDNTLLYVAAGLLGALGLGALLRRKGKRTAAHAADGEYSDAELAAIAEDLAEQAAEFE